MKSIDEYSISVEGQRGLKEFQYDQVFMEDSTQEKIFEDTNVSLSSFRIPVSVLTLKAPPIICSRRQFQILLLFQKYQIRHDIS